MNIIALGDIHERLEFKGFIEDELKKADMVIVTGDLTQFGGVAKARRVIESLKPLNQNILAQAGNLDNPEVNAYLEELGICLHGRGYFLGDAGIFGVGGSNPSPFSTPNELSEEEINRLLEKGYSEIRDTPVKIMVPHMPPLNTAVDRVHSGAHVGSSSVRNFIEKNQPDLCLTGHIHEAAGEDRLGKSHIINPGPFFNGGYVAVDYDGKNLNAELRFFT